jgi:methylmalonyl-CoA epimerase
VEQLGIGSAKRGGEGLRVRGAAVNQGFHGQGEIELIAPFTEDSGIAKYLAKRGAGMHHICIEVEDIDGLMAQLVANGIELINETPRSRPDGRRYAPLTAGHAARDEPCPPGAAVHSPP